MKMKKKKIGTDYNPSPFKQRVEIYEGFLEGKVREVHKTSEKESVFTIKSGNLEEKIRVPFKVHARILKDSPVSYKEIEEHIQGFEPTGWELEIDGPSMRGKHYKEIRTEHYLWITGGEFKGIKYKGSQSLEKKYLG